MASAPLVSSISIDNRQQVGRTLRRPQHTFNTRFRPWQIQPFLLAPVLPGETMKNLLLQARIVTDPITNSMIGWHAEFYLFYVKLRDLNERDQLTDMIMTNSVIPSGPANLKTMFNGTTGLDFGKMCLDRVVETYFRDEDEPILAAAIDGLPLAQTGLQHFTDSAQLDSAVQDTGEELPGENPQLPPHLAQFGAHFEQWEAMRSMQLTAATFEDWLRTFGVSPPGKEKHDLHRPELVRYVRDWSYPSNAINPADQKPYAGLSWSIAERADKDRFFAEPGFVFGVQVCRPKVYMALQNSTGASMLSDAFAWLPAILQDQPYTSLKKFAGGTGPLAPALPAGAANDYWVDLRDLLVHGDQFTNYAPTFADKVNAISAPSPNGRPRFATEAAIDSLFLGGTLGRIRCDGRADLSILSRIEDTSL